MRFYTNCIRMICDRNAMTYEWHANGMRFYAKKSKEKKSKAKKRKAKQRKEKQSKEKQIKQKQTKIVFKFVCKF